MGGIFGFICSKEREVRDVIIGLQRLIYRGYDGWGLTYFRGEEPIVIKQLGSVSSSPTSINERSYLAVGHTRYASRGWPTLENTHPLMDCHKNIYVFMDGIIDDYEKIRDELTKSGHKFVSTTDTEILAHLLELKDLKEVMDAVKGIFSAVVLKKGEKGVYAINKGQPILLGLGKECYFLSSDLPSLSGFAEEAVIIPDNSVLYVLPTSYEIFADGTKPSIKRVKYQPEISEKAGFPHFMLKEIYDIPEAVINSYYSLMQKYLTLAGMIVYGGKNVFIVGNGTSLHAGLIASYYLGEMGIQSHVVSAAEFPYYSLENVTTGSVIIAISQSGETSDVIKSVKLAKIRGAVIIGVTNSVGSRLALESNVYLPITAGPEMAVPATKTFTSTLIALRTLSLYVGLNSGKAGNRDIADFESRIRALSSFIKDSLNAFEEEAETAASKIESASLYVTSSGINYPLALEGALKLKEAAGTHAEGIQLGELLHGPITLTLRGHPVIAIKPAETAAEDLFNKVIKTVTDREGKVFVIKVEKTFGWDLSPVVNAIPIQLVAYKLGVRLGLPIDTPPGLVKAVVV
ncbi:glutamine--fructose-6-phosphate aminotransferase [Sulfolobales archaeon HS-7]|nr:glutamine--fructose-6-phosphate aminotransferase [Sulfolobales archaeon HS-7]